VKDRTIIIVDDPYTSDALARLRPALEKLGASVVALEPRIRRELAFLEPARLPDLSKMLESFAELPMVKARLEEAREEARRRRDMIAILAAMGRAR
jgi:hypothetical protein